MLQTLRKYCEVYRIQIKNNLAREASYRTNFFTIALVDLVWICVEFSLFKVIYANTPSLAGWRQEQVFFFLGVFFTSDALFTFLFQRNFWTFTDLVNRGELDIFLTKPIHPLFLALTRWVNFSALFNLVLGIAISIFYAKAADFLGGWKWILFVSWLGIGLLTAILLRFAFAIWVFWTERSWAISQLYYHFFSFATKPDVIYPKIIRYTILTALPFALIGSIPARALMTGLEIYEYFWLFGVLIVFFFFDRWMWRKGLKRYQSASS
ncbi:MAG: ABC-2 family transporter protein [Deltaproteobacteria bacterium]|nr:ABC-2 family transporter protein [Deltaproteobacteria bacterium]